MPMSYRIDTGRRIVFITLTGDLNLEEYKEYLETRERDPDYDPTMGGLVDARNARYLLETEAMRELATISKQFLPKTKMRRAIVVSGDLSFGMARMFQLLMGDDHLEYGVFRDYDKALEWLEKS